MKHDAHLQRPSREQIALMPVFAGLTLDRIELVSDAAQAERAAQALVQAGHVGFDTESKPTFKREEINTGPHLVQFATLDRAYLVQVGPSMPADFLREMIESTEIVKVGFGLKSDRSLLAGKTGYELHAALDLAQVLRESGYRQAVGIRAAVAIVLGQRLQKSKTATTSNWAARSLRPNQLLYAANDAYAALKVFHGLGLAVRPRPA